MVIVLEGVVLEVIVPEGIVPEVIVPEGIVPEVIVLELIVWSWLTFFECFQLLMRKVTKPSNNNYLILLLNLNFYIRMIIEHSNYNKNW